MGFFSTWSAMRRLTSIFILAFDYLLDGHAAPLAIWASVSNGIGHLSQNDR